MSPAQVDFVFQANSESTTEKGSSGDLVSLMGGLGTHSGRLKGSD